MKRLWILLLLLLLPLTASAQVDVGAIEITGVDHSSYPTISISFTAQNSEGAGIEAIEGLQVTENGNSIDSFELMNLPSGVDVTFVIDANRTIEGIDLIGDVSRLAKVRQTIADFATQYVSRTNSDRISVIAPNEGSAQFLLRDVTYPDLIAEGILAYAPPQLPAQAPVQTMLELAFEQAAQREPTDKYQAIVLFSDTEFLREQVDFFALREMALQSDVVFFGAILGKVASQEEVENINELAIPTGGSWIHMPNQVDFDPLVQIIKSNSSRTQVSYRSTMVESGSAAVQLGLGAVSAETTYDITIAPPTVQLVANQPIVREGDIGTSVDQYEPTVHPVTAQLSWNDGYPRAVDNVRLFVNGLEQRLPQPPILDTRGSLTVVWDIRNLGTGTYQIEVEVTDELGLTTRSAAQLQRIEAEPIRPPETPTPETVAPVATATVASPVSQQIERSLGYLTPERMTTGLIFLIAVLFITLMFRWARRHQEKEVEALEPVEAPRLLLPPNVFLELLDDARGASHLIPIKTETVSIGSDPFKADVILNDSSVSRFHARIAYENSQFVLYDEGSAYGTRVNYERVGLAPKVVVDGDELTFGAVRLRFRIFGVEGAGNQDQQRLRVQEAPPHLTGEETPIRERPMSDNADQTLPPYLLEEHKQAEGNDISDSAESTKRPIRDLRRDVEQPTDRDTTNS